MSSSSEDENRRRQLAVEVIMPECNPEGGATVTSSVASAENQQPYGGWDKNMESDLTGYGSCTYPSSPSTAGQTGSPGSISMPGTPTPKGTGSTGGLSPPDVDSTDSNAEPLATTSLPSLALSCFMYMFLQLW